MASYLSRRPILPRVPRDISGSQRTAVFHPLIIDVTIETTNVMSILDRGGHCNCPHSLYNPCFFLPCFADISTSINWIKPCPAATMKNSHMLLCQRCPFVGYSGTTEPLYPSEPSRMQWSTVFSSSPWYQKQLSFLSVKTIISSFYL